MNAVTSSAPGKVVIAGEYAVLHGAPGVVMAVDRRASVRVTPGEGDWHRLSAPGFLDQPRDFRLDKAGAVVPRHGEAETADLSLVGRVCKATAIDPDSPLHFVVDTRAFFHPVRSAKLGLGSSAAVSVALAAAMLRFAGDVRDPVPIALAAHRDFQAGRGSGVDVAAAARGGILAYRAGDPAAARQLQWPAGLHWALLWSGRASNTAAKVTAYLASGQRTEASGRLMSAAENVLINWPNANTVLGALEEYTQCLIALSAAHDLGIFAAGHQALHEFAAERGLVYKPCGAGGGDIGILLGNDEDELMSFVETAEAHGFERLAVAVDPRGVEVV